MWTFDGGRERGDAGIVGAVAGLPVKVILPRTQLAECEVRSRHG